ncbi:GTPase-activating protein [Martiniozyma asiatica (nom. inval.)]|nr:GTPase-activating protein [Martiniozyma asiatica]
MWRKGYHQPIDDQCTFQPPETIVDEPSTPKCSPSGQSKGLFKTITSISPFYNNPNLSPAAIARSESPGMKAHSFLEGPLMSRTSIENPPLRKKNSNNSLKSTKSGNLSRSNSNSSSKSNKKSGIRLSFGKARQGNGQLLLDEDWDTDIVNTPMTTSNSLFPDLNSLSIDDEPVIINKGDYITDNQPSQLFVEEADENCPYLKKNYRELMKDPYSCLKQPYCANNPDEASKFSKIVNVLTSPTFEFKQLKDISWKGIPTPLRAVVWQILVGYIPTNESTRDSVIDRKRKEYTKSVTRAYAIEKEERIWHQIHIDVPRTNPSIKLYSYPATQRSLEKILYLWAIRHPASGYVQGINDLVTPFFQVFLNHYLMSNVDVENFDPKVLPSELLNCVEADTYWCLTKVLDTIQDNYIHEQPGIFRQINELKRLIGRDEKGLAQHFEKENIDFLQFAFRWMNCMLMREFKLNLIIRMWDTYLSEFPTGFSDFHVYVCCAFLRKFTEILMEMEFQDIIMFLQDIGKTESWEESDIEMLLSEAYLWEMLYGGAAAHYK